MFQHQKNYEELFIGDIGAHLCRFMKLKEISRLYSCSKAMHSSYNLRYAIQTRWTKFHKEYTEKYQCRVLYCDWPVIFSPKLSETLTELEYLILEKKLGNFYDIIHNSKRLRKLTVLLESWPTSAIDLNCLAKTNLRYLRLEARCHLLSFSIEYLPNTLENLQLYAHIIDLLYPLVDLPYLKHLRIESESINGDMNWIYNLPKLESIELIISEPTFDIERILIGSKNLRVAGFKDINYEAAYFSIAENVTILSIYSYEMTITSLPPRLEALYLYHATLIDFDKAIEYPNLTKVIMDRVTNCHQLLSRCPNLTKLTLKSMRNFHLIEFPNVIDLEFFRCSMTDLSFLTNFPRLKRVTFIWCQLSPQDIAYWSSRVTLVIKKE